MIFLKREGVGEREREREKKEMMLHKGQFDDFFPEA